MDIRSIRGVNPARYTGSSFLWSGWVVSFYGPGLMPALCLLSGSLSVSSFLTSALVTLDFLSLTIQSGHRFLQSFFMSEIEYGIDNRSLVLESP